MNGSTRSEVPGSSVEPEKKAPAYPLCACSFVQSCDCQRPECTVSAERAALPPGRFLEPLEGELLPPAREVTLTTFPEPKRVPPLPFGAPRPFAELEREPVPGGSVLAPLFRDFERIFGGKP